MHIHTVEHVSHDFFLICKHIGQFKVVLLVTQMGTLLNSEFCCFQYLVCFHLGSVGRDSVREEAGGGDGDFWVSVTVANNKKVWTSSVMFGKT